MLRRGLSGLLKKPVLQVRKVEEDGDDDDTEFDDVLEINSDSEDSDDSLETTGTADTLKTNDLTTDTIDITDLLTDGEDEEDEVMIIRETHSPRPPANPPARKKRKKQAASLFQSGSSQANDLFCANFHVTSANNENRQIKKFLKTSQSLAQCLQSVCTEAKLNFNKCHFYVLQAGGDLDNVMEEGTRLMNLQGSIRMFDKIITVGCKICIIERMPRSQAQAGSKKKEEFHVKINQQDNTTTVVPCSKQSKVSEVIKKFLEIVKLPPTTKVVLEFDDEDLDPNATLEDQEVDEAGYSLDARL